MKSSAFYTVIGVGVILVAAIIWFGIHSHTSKSASATATSTQATSPPLTGLSIYTNGEYGFVIFYPQADKTETTFDTQNHLPSTWRLNALPNAGGNAIFAIVKYDAENSFESEVRIGASTDSQELGACEKASSGETTLPDTVINKVIWKTFSLQNTSFTPYMQGTSYRTIHDNTCFALEAFEINSNHQNLSSIVQTFTFARP